ncbi:MAG: hypothetical protein AABZ30_03995 [Myxococcota bacterium]
MPEKARQRVASAWAGLLVRRPGGVLAALLAVAALSAWASSRLTINTNQLDLISQDLRQVKDVKRVVEMVGGAGHLIVALRGSDERTLKAVADHVAGELSRDTAHVRSVTYKVATEWMRAKAGLFMETADLEELRRRVTAKLQDVVKRASPFFFEIRKTEPVKLELADLIDKYRRIGKKSITDDYYISDDRQMILLIVKPLWDGNELAKTGAFVDALRARLRATRGPSGARLIEDYSGKPDPDGRDEPDARDHHPAHGNSRCRCPQPTRAEM